MSGETQLIDRFELVDLTRLEVKMVFNAVCNRRDKILEESRMKDSVIFEGYPLEERQKVVDNWNTFAAKVSDWAVGILDDKTQWFDEGDCPECGEPLEDCDVCSECGWSIETDEEAEE